MILTQVALAPAAPRSAAEILLKPDPEMQELDARLGDLVDRRDRTEGLLGLSRDERLARCNRALYQACFEVTSEKFVPLRKALRFATMGLGVASAIGASLNGAPLVGAGLLAGAAVAAFAGVPGLYDGIVKKWFLPGEMDKLVVPALQRESSRLSTAIQETRDAKAALQERILNEVGDDVKLVREEPEQVQVEEAFVVIGGVRLPVRPAA